jgi:hypothetical protein
MFRHYADLPAFLADVKVEPDQRIDLVLQRGAKDSVDLLRGLLKTNPSFLRETVVPDEFAVRLDKWADGQYKHHFSPLDHRLFERAIRGRRTLGVNDFLMALFEDAQQFGDDYSQRPFCLDMLIHALDGGVTQPLSKSPNAQAFSKHILGRATREEDFQYIIGLEEDRLVFRITSLLDDYVQASSSGVLMPRRALLTHFQDEFGGFTADEIAELESLLNSASAREREFQEFFERHPHFLRKFDYREIYPHVTLARSEGSLIPDFILTDRELQKAAILDLKLPSPRLIRRHRNRDRFAACVTEARAQLLRYRDWFRERANRHSLLEKVGIEVYEPQLIVVIGRSFEFEDAFDRMRLRADNPDIEVVTYDDMLSYAKRRRLIISQTQVSA